MPLRTQHSSHQSRTTTLGSDNGEPVRPTCPPPCTVTALQGHQWDRRLIPTRIAPNTPVLHSENPRQAERHRAALSPERDNCFSTVGQMPRHTKAESCEPSRLPPAPVSCSVSGSFIQREAKGPIAPGRVRVGAGPVQNLRHKKLSLGGESSPEASSGNKADLSPRLSPLF